MFGLVLILSLTWPVSSQISFRIKLLDTHLLHYNYSSCTDQQLVEEYGTCSVSSQKQLEETGGVCSQGPPPCPDGSINMICLLWHLNEDLYPSYTCRCQDRLKPQLPTAGYSWSSWELITDPTASQYREMTDTDGIVLAMEYR